jgi:RNA polymerase sigma factor (sigma-70 family)
VKDLEPLNEEEIEMVKKHTGLAISLASKYATKVQADPFLRDDLTQTALLALMRAAKFYDPEIHRKAKFSTYFVKTLYGFLGLEVYSHYSGTSKRYVLKEHPSISYLNNQFEKGSTESVKLFDDVIESVNPYDALEQKIDLEIALNSIKIKDIDKQYFYAILEEDGNMAAVAKKFGCCRENVRLKYKKVYNKLKKFCNNTIAS